MKIQNEAKPFKKGTIKRWKTQLKSEKAIKQTSYTEWVV